MMNCKLILSLVSTILLPSSVICCPDEIGWIPAGESCYRVSNDHMNWFEAQIYCADHGGYLAEIKSPEETEMVISMIETDAMYYWIGLSDAAEHGKWVWEYSYEPTEYTHWGSGEPTFLETEHCGAVMTSNAEWGDLDCTYSTWWDLKPIHAFCEAPNE